MFLASSVNVSSGSRKTPVFGGFPAGILSSLRVLLPRLRLACEGSSHWGRLSQNLASLSRGDAPTPLWQLSLHDVDEMVLSDPS